MTRVPYEADGWGEGELWFEGPLLVWHELPQPVATRPVREAARGKGSAETGRFPQREALRGPPHPHPGGVDYPPPLRRTIPAKRARVGNRTAPNARRLIHKLRRYFAGEPTDFNDVLFDVEGYTSFQVDVVRALQRVPYGEVVTYAELARSAGYANAQRAAGTFCARNRYPLVLPCHRVVAANGIGSYGSLGIEYKRRLLELEGSADAL